MIQQDGRSVPLGLAKLQTDVRVVGAIAETTATMTFTNPLERIMEGYLYFPLPEGATVSSYALDINGAMIDGVAVGKYEARRIFEELERRRIDPGLVEWTKPNTFQARVFPIPAHGSRVIRVGYISELIRDHHGASYRLPLPMKNKLPEFTLRVEVVRRSVPPQVTNGNIHQFTFAKWCNGFVAETTLRNWKPEEDLVIALPKVDRPQVAVEKADDGQCYFTIDAEPEVPWNDQPVPSVKRVVVFWDASGSRAGDHHREIALLRQILNARIRSNVSRSATIMVDLVLVRNAVAKPLRFRFSKSAIAAALEEITYDGGTQLGAMGPPPGANKPDLYLLFTDGHSNFGRTEPARLDAPLDIFCTSSSAPHAELQSLAADSGGQYFDLSRQTDADILASLSGSPWAFLSVAVNGGEAENLYRIAPEALSVKIRSLAIPIFWKASSCRSRSWAPVLTRAYPTRRESSGNLNIEASVCCLSRLSL